MDWWKDRAWLCLERPSPETTTLKNRAKQINGISWNGLKNKENGISLNGLQILMKAKKYNTRASVMKSTGFLEID